MKFTSFLISSLLLTSCISHTSVVNLNDYESRYKIECGQELLHCHRTASSLCEHGYDLVENISTVVEQTPHYGEHPIIKVRNSLTVQCNQY
jgi:hypothetical protein